MKEIRENGNNFIVPDFGEQKYFEKMLEDIKYQHNNFDKRVKAASEARIKMIDSKREKIKMLKYGTLEQKIELLSQKYISELEKEISRLEGK